LCGLVSGRWFIWAFDMKLTRVSRARGGAGGPPTPARRRVGGGCSVLRHEDGILRDFAAFSFGTRDEKSGSRISG